MTVVKNPRGRAMATKTRKQAARLAASLEAELALNDNLPDGWEAEADAALQDLKSRFSTLEEDDAYLAGPSSLSRGAKANMGGLPESEEVRSEGRRRAGSTRAGSGGQGAPRSSRAGRRGRPARRSRSRSTGWLGGAVRDTGIPAAGQSTSKFLLQTLGLMLGMALLFLVLRNAEQSGRGRSVVDLITGGVTGFVNLVISPVDPLSPRTSSRVSRDAGGGSSGSSPQVSNTAGGAVQNFGDTFADKATSTPAARAQDARRQLRQSSRSPLLPTSPLNLP